MNNTDNLNIYIHYRIIIDIRYAIKLYSHVMSFVRTIQDMSHLHDFVGVTEPWKILTLVTRSLL